jgi:hypothetical protein
MATPIAEVVQQMTTLHIPMAMRPKMMLPIAMAAQPKTTPRIAVGGQRTMMQECQIFVSS